MAKRIFLDQCCGVIIDVQELFLSSLARERRAQTEINTLGFASLLKYLRIPTLATLERPLELKGAMPIELDEILKSHDQAEVFEKEFFDLTKHKEIIGYLQSLKRKQALVAGCETDVCVLQSCLGLIERGFEVFLVEDLLFSSAATTASALDRLKAAGAVPLSLKTLYYELMEAVETGSHRADMKSRLGPPPFQYEAEN